MLIYAHLLAGLARMIWHRVQTSDLSNIRSINIPWSEQISLSHATWKRLSSPQAPEVSPCYIRWSWHPWATAVLEAHPCGQEALSISKFTSSVWRSSLTISTGALPEHCWHPNSHPSIHRIDMNWSIFALLNLTSDDSMRRNISLILHIGSWVSKKSPLCRCQRYGWTPKQDVSIKRAALIMTRTHLKSRLLNFKETLKRGTRHITSIEIWSSDLELRYPLNLLNLTE